MPKSDDSLYRALQAEADRLDHEPVPTSQTLSGKTDSYDLDLAKRVGGCVITARSGPLADKTFMLVDRALVIGRNPQCDIRLDDESVLPRHAAILKKEGDPIIDDLDTASVIYLNGDRVRRSPLKPGDVIRIGVSEFLVHL